MSSNDLWLEKYRPITLNDYIGKEDDIKEIKEWIENYFNKDHETEKVLLLYGNPGVGKTTLARIIFGMYNYEIVEFNSSNYRTKKLIKENIGCIGTSSIVNTYSGFDAIINKPKLKKVGLLMDEVDGITTNHESSGIQELVNIIDSKKDNNKMPIICTCNSIKNKKIKLLVKRALTIKLLNPKKKELRILANKIIEAEKLNIKKTLLDKIISKSTEYRELINILYQISIFLRIGKNNKEILNSNIFKNQNNKEIQEGNNKEIQEANLENDYYINNRELLNMDNIISKLKYIFENNVNMNDILLSCVSDNQLYILSLDKNIMNILKYFKIDNDLRYNLYKYISNNLINLHSTAIGAKKLYR